jgi:hypothetical protein
MQYHQTAVVPRESILKTEAEWLGSVKADLVVTTALLHYDSVNAKLMLVYGHGYPALTEWCYFCDRSRMLFLWCAGRLQMQVSARCALGILGELLFFPLCFCCIA